MTMFVSQGRAEDFDGAHVDLILTNPYGPLAKHLSTKPMLITNFTERKAQCEKWLGAELTEIGVWENGRSRIWAANVEPLPVATNDLVSDDVFFPVELPLLLLNRYAEPGITVLDPFCGRSTVGRACQILGMNFIGVDIDPARIEMSKEFLHAG